MDLATARSVLGVSPADEWGAVRDAYRTLIRATHPDLVGPRGTARTLEVNAAYRTLVVARREGRLHDTDGAPAGPPSPRPPPAPRRRPTGTGGADDVRIAGGDTIVLSTPPAETFRRLVEAAHALGEISYVDRSAAIFEAVFRLADGTPASFVVSLQWRAHDATCEAFCTLEALDHAEQLDVSGVLEQLALHIPPDEGS